MDINTSYAGVSLGSIRKQ